MSKLTNCQIEALIRGMESTIDSAKHRGDRAAVRRKLPLLEKYRAELAQRKAAGQSPDAADIQAVRYGQ